MIQLEFINIIPLGILTFLLIHDIVTFILLEFRSQKMCLKFVFPYYSLQ